MKFTKETLRRVLRTFFQAFTGSIAADIAIIANVDFHGDGWWMILITSILAPALAAGAAAIMNLEPNE